MIIVQLTRPMIVQLTRPNDKKTYVNMSYVRYFEEYEDNATRRAVLDISDQEQISVRETPGEILDLLRQQG